MPKVRYTCLTSTGSEAPRLHTRREHLPSGAVRLIHVNPETGHDLTDSEMQNWLALREQTQYTEYVVSFWTQPLYRYLLYRIYHFYDWHVVKVPGYYRLDNWLFERAIRRAKKKGRDTIQVMPWAAQQDCRCYELSRRGRTHLGEVTIPEELYDKIANSGEAQ